MQLYRVLDARWKIYFFWVIFGSNSGGKKHTSSPPGQNLGGTRPPVPPVIYAHGCGQKTRDSKKLKAIRSRYDIRKYTFSVRTVNLWNSLSEEVVAAESVNSFKNRLDKFWEKQEIKYNWKAKLTGAGIRSLDM